MTKENTRRGFTQRCFPKGFTLIELLVVVLIIGILVAVALPQYNKAVEKSRLSEALVAIAEIERRDTLCFLENGDICNHVGKEEETMEIADQLTYFDRNTWESFKLLLPKHRGYDLLFASVTTPGCKEEIEAVAGDVNATTSGEIDLPTDGSPWKACISSDTKWDFVCQSLQNQGWTFRKSY